MRDDKERLLDIIEAIEKIEKYSSIGYDTFIEDERTQVWIIHHHRAARQSKYSAKCYI